jgi:two-component system, chemotaxis family, chemotaxis protein CheY
MTRVLIAEDSHSVRSFIRTVLESLSVPGGQFEIHEATSGFDALRILPRGRWDLVISDINMPDINGLELLVFVRRSDVHRSTPVILISTQSSEKDQQKGLTLGANAYLVKPFTSEQLATEVQRQIGLTSAGSHG